MSLKNKELYEFGDFRLDVEEHTLTRSDGLKNGQLPEKAFQTLIILVRSGGRLLTKQELIDQIWPDSFVEENNLDKCVHAIRHVLGEKPGEQKFIETVRKHGYRFVATVKTLETPREEPASLLDSEFLTEPTTFKTHSRPTISTATTESGAFVVSAKWNLEDDGKIVQENGQRIAHLTESENRADLEQTLPAKRYRFRRLRRSATYVVTGIVLLMVVSLYEYLNGPYITKVYPSPELGTTNEEAYRLYRQAENLGARRNQENMPTALGYLNQAVTLDPDFARAWAAKAHLHRYIAEYPGADQAEQYKTSMDALGKALAIDPNLSEAHSALCLNKLRYEFDSAGAESACIRALELDPDSSVGHKVYATFLYSRGRFDEAIAEIKRALDLQPLALEHQQTYALALYYARRYEEEEAQWKRLIELNPTHGFIYTRLFMNLKQQGKDDKAFDYLIKKLALNRVDNEIIERFRTAYAASGWRGVTIERIKHPETESFTGPFDVACLYATVGNRDKAFEYLEKAYLEHSYRIAVLQVEPQLDPLRNDPRYADLVRRVEGN